ncbi:MAG TPA: FAD-dependent oxidoreductase [Verrucomicrobiae bacterium]
MHNRFTQTGRWATAAPDSEPLENRRRVIILGGGFGGVNCARTLSRELKPGEAEVVLFSRENHLVFSPLLAEAVGASINPLDIVVPLRQLLPRVFCRTEEVRAIDFARSEIEYETADHERCRMAYDQLVIACGNTANLQATPGMAEHGFALKNIDDALALRCHILERMERAEVCADPGRRRRHLTFVVVGGGFSGVEVAGDVNDLVRSSARYFKNFVAKDISVRLVHSGSQLLPEINRDLREFARKKLEHAGIQVTLGARVRSALREGVALEGGQFIEADTIVCTAGSAPARVLEHLAVAREKGRLATRPDMRLRDWSKVWAIGDSALILNQFDQRLSPPTGQFAERQGAQCARNIVRVLRDQPTRPFHFKPFGTLCSIGGHSAVAELFGLSMAGFLAWFVWRGVYLFKLPTWLQRLQVGFDWALLLLFPRDLSHLRHPAKACRTCCVQGRARGGCTCSFFAACKRFQQATLASAEPALF